MIEKSEEFEKIKNSQIIIDSCILIYCQIEPYKQEIRSILRSFVNNGNELAISQISFLEVLRGAKKDDRKYYIKLLKYLNSVPISEEVIVNSIILHNIYINLGITKESDKRDWTGDVIIGATAMFQKSLIFTSNRRDFPEKVWKVVAIYPVIYKSYDKFELINLYLLESLAQILLDKLA